MQIHILTSKSWTVITLKLQLPDFCYLKVPLLLQHLHQPFFPTVKIKSQQALNTSTGAPQSEALEEHRPPPHSTKK